ncbi:hypothetical protein G6L37_02990 [Agrobacterium rubi]|nr:hypothetical protein [Agrobacterium rubi]NTF24344.1 hypothetical protein [Agrobacterium rubi]
MSCDFVTKLKDIDGGLTASIHYDQDTEMPYGGDEAVHIVILSGKYDDPSKGALGKDPKTVEKWRKDNSDEWYSVPLWAYVHSGSIWQVAAENPFSCPFDSARAGIIALKRSEWGNGAESDEKMFEFAKGVASTYTEWANGECYGYVIKNEDGDEVDACWGFIGMDAVEAEARSAASNLARTPAVATP